MDILSAVSWNCTGVWFLLCWARNISMADTAAAFWSQLETMRPRGISVVGREGGEATAAAEGPRSEEEEEEEERRERRRRKEM